MRIPASISVRWGVAAGAAVILFATLFVSDRLLLDVSGQATYAECRNGITVPNPTTNTGLVADCDILWEARDTLQGTTSILSNWSATNAVSTWTGVTVAGTPPRVTLVLLRGYIGSRMNGTIPARLGDLSNLTHLYLQENQLSGSIPRELWKLSNLQHLTLGGNRLTGSIPAELVKLSNLQLLDLQENSLTGSIPWGLGNLSGLLELHLGRNQLTGSIPAELGNLSNLQFLNLEYNRLTGSIPRELGNLSKLRILYIRHNSLTGLIPSELGGIATLQFLIVNGNRLSGGFPLWVTDIPVMTHLYLEDNRLTGPLPLTDPLPSGISEFKAGGNRFIGCRPSWYDQSPAGRRDIRDLGLPACGSPPSTSVWYLDADIDPQSLTYSTSTDQTVRLSLRATYTIPNEYLAATTTPDRFGFQSLSATVSSAGTVTVTVSRDGTTANPQYVGFDTRTGSPSGAPTSAQLGLTKTVNSTDFTCTSVATQGMTLPDPAEVVCSAAVDMWVLNGAGAESPYTVAVAAGTQFTFTAVLNGSNSEVGTVGGTGGKNWEEATLSVQDPPTPTPTITPTATPTVTATPTATPVPTITPTPTATPTRTPAPAPPPPPQFQSSPPPPPPPPPAFVAISTPPPTATLTPTSTPPPTATLTPTSTPPPTATPTPTPPPLPTAVRMPVRTGGATEVTSSDSTVQLLVPAGSAPANVEVALTRLDAASAVGAPPGDRERVVLAAEVETYAAGSNTPVPTTYSQGVDLRFALPEGEAAACAAGRVRVYWVNDGEWTLLEHRCETDDAGAVWAVSTLTHFSTYLMTVDDAPTTPTPAPTSTATPTPVPTATVTPMPTATHTPIPTATRTPVPTAVPTATHTSTAIPTATRTPVPTAVPTATHTPTAIPTATRTPVPTAVPTATHTPTAIPTATHTPAPTATHTPVMMAAVQPGSAASPIPVAPAQLEDRGGGSNVLAIIAVVLLVIAAGVVAVYLTMRRRGNHGTLSARQE